MTKEETVYIRAIIIDHTHRQAVFETGPLDRPGMLHTLAELLSGLTETPTLCAVVAIKLPGGDWQTLPHVYGARLADVTSS